MDIDAVLSDDTIMAALKHIQKKKGKPGIDTMDAEELPKYWETHGNRIKAEIRNGSYLPQPVIVKLIPKPGKAEKRKLEIPCVLDRMILYAIHMALSPYYELVFSQNSYGFRTNLKCRDALKACLCHMNQGCRFIVDLDIKDFFDQVNHNLLFQRLQQDIHDPCLLSLIKKYVQTKVIKGRHIYKNYIGLAQGSAASPLLANIFLDAFDQYMDQRMIRFIRYADDIVIFCMSQAEAEQNLALAGNYLTETLKLTLNKEKTKILQPEQLHYLGYAFMQDNSPLFSLSIDWKTKVRMLERMQEHMDLDCTSMEEWWQRLGSFHRGWVNYYKDAPPAILLPFLQSAEAKQLWYFTNKVSQADEELSQQYISALFNCPYYSSLTGWYDFIIETELGG